MAPGGPSFVLGEVLTSLRCPPDSAVQKKKKSIAPANVTFKYMYRLMSHRALLITPD